MERIFCEILITTALSLVISGCSDSEMIEPQPALPENPAEEFQAAAESGATRTSLQGYSVVWSEDDRVAAFTGNDEVKEYRVKAGCGGTSSTTLIPLRANSPSGGKYDFNLAFYPFDAVEGLNTSSGQIRLKTNIPSVQPYANGSFAQGSMPMVAVTSSSKDRNLSFKNVYGVLKFRMKSDNIKISSVKIEGNDGERLSGLSTVLCSSDGEPVIEFDSSASTSVTLDCGDDGLSADSNGEFEFYIPLPPQTFKKGFTATFTTTGGERIVRKISNEITLKRSTILPLQEGKLSDEKYIDLIYNVNSTSSEMVMWHPFAIGNFPISPFIHSSFVDTPITITRIVYDGEEEVTNRFSEYHKFKRTGDVLVRVYYKGNLTAIGFGSYGYDGMWGNRKECRLKEITIPESVTYVMLKDLPVLSSVTYKRSEAFKYCSMEVCPSLSKITSPFASKDGRCIISEDGTLIAFAPCGITEYQIPEGVKSITYKAFNGNKTLTSITFPSTLKKIGSDAFGGALSLRTVNGLDYVEEIGDKAFNSTSIESVSLTSAVKIGGNAFGYCKKLVNASLSMSLEEIPGAMFTNCPQLREIKLPNELKSIGREAFSDCKSLTEISIPPKTSEIGARSFNGASLSSVFIPKSVRSIGYYAFGGNHSKSVTFEKGIQLERIEETAFWANDFETIEIPASVSFIEASAFSDCKNLKSVYFEAGSNLTHFSSNSSYGAFRDCTSLSEIYIPESLLDLGSGTFYGCTSLKECTIPNSVQTIGYKTFYESGIQKVVIPNSVQSIGSNAFYGCGSLEEISLGSGLTSLDLTAFLFSRNIKKIVSESSSYVSSPDNMFLISSEGKVMLFANNNPLTQYSFPKTVKDIVVKEIGPLLFAYNETLTTVRLPETMEVIGMKSFLSEKRNHTIKSVYCEAITPPTLIWTDPVIDSSMGGWIIGTSSDPFPAGCVFYVPSESIDQYRKAWYEHTDFYPLP